METPYFDEAVDMYERMQTTSSEKEKLKEYKAIKEALSIHSVSQQSELLNALSDSIYKEFQTYAYLPDLIEHIKSFNCG